MTLITKAMVRDFLESFCTGISKAYLESTFKMLSDSVAKRGKENQLSFTKLLFGAHVIDGKYVFDITSDPWDVFRFGTGSKARMSCLFHGSVYRAGLYDDIEKQNVVAVVKDREMNARGPLTVHARVMLRWCKTKRKKREMLGMEPVYYSYHAGMDIPLNSVLEIAYGLTAKKATEVLKDVLESAKMLDYKVCVTKDEYLGFSEAAGSTNVKVRYNRP